MKPLTVGAIAFVITFITGILVTAMTGSSTLGVVIGFLVGVPFALFIGGELR